MDYSYTRMSTAESTWIKPPRVWDLLGKAGKHVVVLGIPQTFPPPAVNGELVSCFLTPDPRTDTYTSPSSLRDEIESLLGQPYKVDVEDYRTDDRDRILAEIYEMTDQRFTVARHLLESRPWDFFMMHEIGLDRIHHAFWRFMDTTHRDYQPGHRFADAIHSYYQYLDDCISDLLELFDDETTVFVVSDHGSQKMEGALAINEWMIREGYLVLKEPVEGSVPLAKAPVDWSRSRAWGEGGHYSRLLLNVKGREAEGIVEPEEYEPLRQELIHKREALTGPDGASIGNRVHRPEDLWPVRQGIPPDLVLYPGGLSWRANGTVGGGQIFRFDNDTGPDDANLGLDGGLVMAGPDATPGRREGMTIMDVAPTVLNLFGLSPEPGMRGHAI